MSGLSEEFKAESCNPGDQYMPVEFVERINEVPVPTELLIQANAACSEVSSLGLADITSRAVAILSVIKGWQFGETQVSEIFTAVSFRLEALERLQDQQHDVLRVWSALVVNDTRSISRRDFWRAAAVEPLVVDGDCPVFEPSGFAQRLLDFSCTSGVA